MPSGVMQRGASRRRYRLLCTVALYAMAINSLAPLAAAAAQSSDNDAKTTTPIKHVIVIIGENRTFDHIFATYQPKNKDETVWNLLSRGIVKKTAPPAGTITRRLCSIRPRTGTLTRSTRAARGPSRPCRRHWPAARPPRRSLRSAMQWRRKMGSLPIITSS